MTRVFLESCEISVTRPFRVTDSTFLAFFQLGRISSETIGSVDNA